MYEPSTNFYSLAVQKQVRRISWSGTVKDSNGTVRNFTDEDIVKDSGTITNEISDSSMRIGTVFSSELKLGLYVDSIGVNRSLLYGGEISISCTITHGSTVGTVPMGIFRIVEATQSGEVCSITAYDRMILFDREFPITSGQLTPYEWLAQLCNACGVTLGNTLEEIEALPNGTYRLLMNWSDDTSTYRDVLSHLAAALGCSAHFNRVGELELLQLKDTASVATIDAGDRFGSDIAHTQWHPAAFFVTNKETGAISSAGSGQLLFDLGDNVFLQSDGEEFDPVTLNVITTHTVNAMLSNILASCTSLTVVPIEAEIPLDPCLDLFDVVTLTGGQASNTKTLICSLIHKIGGGTQIECAGQNTTDEPTTSTRGSEGSRDDKMWVSGALNAGEIVAQTSAQYWQDVLEVTWGELSGSTWGELFTGGGWVKLEEWQRTFAEEFTLGVIGLTVEYEVTHDTDVSFKILIERWEFISGSGWHYVPISDWESTEHALRGKHTTSMMLPFGVLDRGAGTVYRVTAFISGIDVIENAIIMTKAEIEELIGGGESS